MDSKIMIILLFGISTFYIDVALGQSAICQKTDSDTLKMTLYAPQSITVLLTAIDPNGVASTACHSTTISDSNMKIEIEYTISTGPPAGADSCFVTVAGGVASYPILGQQNALYVESSDKVYTVTCSESVPENTATTGEIQITAATNMLTAVSLTGETGSVVLEIIDANGNVVTDVDIENPFKFRATLTMGTAARGAVYYDMKVADNSAFTGTYMLDMLDATGCTSISDGPFSTTAFETSLTIAATATTTTVETGDVMFAKFINAGSLYFILSYAIPCATTTDTFCAAHETWCQDQSAKRKRRSTGDMPRNGTAELAVRVNLDSKGTASGLGGNEGTRDSSDNEDLAQCHVAANFWIVSIVLGIMMLLTIIFAVFLFYRLKMEQKTRDKLVEKYGTRNPAF